MAEPSKTPTRHWIYNGTEGPFDLTECCAEAGWNRPAAIQAVHESSGFTLPNSATALVDFQFASAAAATAGRGDVDPADYLSVELRRRLQSIDAEVRRDPR